MKAHEGLPTNKKIPISKLTTEMLRKDILALRDNKSTMHSYLGVIYWGMIILSPPQGDSAEALINGFIQTAFSTFPISQIDPSKTRSYISFINKMYKGEVSIIDLLFPTGLRTFISGYTIPPPAFDIGEVFYDTFIQMASDVITSINEENNRTYTMSTECECPILKLAYKIYNVKQKISELRYATNIFEIQNPVATGAANPPEKSVRKDLEVFTTWKRKTSPQTMIESDPEEQEIQIQHQPEDKSSGAIPKNPKKTFSKPPDIGDNDDELMEQEDINLEQTFSYPNSAPPLGTTVSLVDLKKLKSFLLKNWNGSQFMTYNKLIESNQKDQAWQLLNSSSQDMIITSLPERQYFVEKVMLDSPIFQAPLSTLLDLASSQRALMLEPESTTTTSTRGRTGKRGRK